MEKSVNCEFCHYMQEILGLPEMNPNTYSPLGLAYIGDAIFDVLVKHKILSEGNRQVHKLHERTSCYVQASAQSLMMRTIQQHLTEEENAIYRRGRNTRTVTPAKNQSITDYRRATGFEALLGYLYLKQEYKRLLDLVKIGLDSLEKSMGEDVEATD